MPAFRVEGPADGPRVVVFAVIGAMVGLLYWNFMLNPMRKEKNELEVTKESLEADVSARNVRSYLSRIFGGDAGARAAAWSELLQVGSPSAAQSVAGGGLHQHDALVCDHAASGGAAADRNRLAAQRRVVPLLHRRVKRVHVDVEDPAHVSPYFRTNPFG